MTADAKALQQADRLYEQYGKPLEADHWGEFVAIAVDGRTVVGAEFEDLVRKAKREIGRGNFVFKIGERTVGKWR